MKCFFPHYRRSDTHCTAIPGGVEVVTLRLHRGFETRIHGGLLDGESYPCTEEDAEDQHERVCDLVRCLSSPAA